MFQVGLSLPAGTALDAAIILLEAVVQVGAGAVLDGLA